MRARERCPSTITCLPGREADGERAFGNTPRMIAAFEERIGTPYPYARYSQIAVTDFIFGGMENTSATTQTDRTLHDERAHISTSPATRSSRTSSRTSGSAICSPAAIGRRRGSTKASRRTSNAFGAKPIWATMNTSTTSLDVSRAICEEDAERYRRPIVCNLFRDPIEVFDRHLYEKAGAVLHMLRGELDDERFWRSIAHYVQQNAQRNVETIDLIRAIEEADWTQYARFLRSVDLPRRPSRASR